MQKIQFSGEITESKVEDLLQELKGHYGKGCVVIDSPGGRFDFFSRLAPPLARSGFISIGHEVASAAVVLQLLGRERLALPNSTFFFHEVRTIFGQSGEVTVCDLGHALDLEHEMLSRTKQPKDEFLAHWYDTMARAQSWMLHFMSQQTGLSQGLFVNLMRGNVTLSAQEALKYGIVHRIISEDELVGMSRR